MKNLTLLLMLTVSIRATAQDCYRTIQSWQAAPGGYAISGTATLSSEAGGNLFLAFDEFFQTTPGPDLHVFLSKEFLAPNEDNMQKLDLGSLTEFSGASSYEVGSATELDDYDWVLIHCVSFNHFWGGGELSEVMGLCGTTGLNENSAAPPQILVIGKGVIQASHLPPGPSIISVFDLTGRSIPVSAIAISEDRASIRVETRFSDTIVFVQIRTQDKVFSAKLFLW
jgi:hypothetical protein